MVNVLYFRAFFMLNIHISGRKLWLLQYIIKAENLLSTYHTNVAYCSSALQKHFLRWISFWLGFFACLVGAVVVFWFGRFQQGFGRGGRGKKFGGLSGEKKKTNNTQKTRPTTKTTRKPIPKTWYQKAPNPFILTCVPCDVQQMDIYSNPLLQKSAEELFALPTLPMPYLALTRLHLSKCRHSADVASNGTFLESR